MIVRPIVRSITRPLTRAITDAGVGGGVSIQIAPAEDQPTVTVNKVAPAFATATLHAPKRISGVATNVDMAGDTKFRYPAMPDGVLRPWSNNNTYTETEMMPGTTTRPWSQVIEFNTSSRYVTVYGHCPGAYTVFHLEVNGKWLQAEVFQSAIGAGAFYIHLEFPAGAARKIKFCSDGTNPRLQGFYTELAAPPSRTADAGTTMLCVGDSITGGSQIPPAGGSAFDTWPFAVAAMLGYDHACNAGIGGTMWVPAASGTTEQLAAHFGGRMTKALGVAPDAVVFMGSRNDAGGNQAALDAIAAEVETVLGTLAAYPKVYVAGTITELPQDAAVQAGTLAAGRPFVDLSGLITGTGKSGAPTGDGNADTYIGTDGVHPTFAGHEYIRQQFALRLQGIGARA